MDKSSEYKVVGKRPIRHDGVDKVTGRAKFGADINLPGMLYGSVLRSPHAHAVIKSIDTSAVMSHPDVFAVMTSEDLVPGPTVETVFPAQNYSENVMARNKVLYKGHPVAAIAASNSSAAQEALSLIKVNYEKLPGVFDVENAISTSSPILHENVNPYSLGSSDYTQPNVLGHELYELGDINEGFKQAEYIFEEEYKTSTVHQGYIEPQNGTASWSEDGKLTVWCSSQGHFGIRDQLGRILGISISDINVIPMEIGGGFGGKLPAYLEPLAAVLSKKTGRPVKLTMSRSEVFESTGPTSGSLIRMKMGFDSNHRITAAYAYIAFEAGAYPPSPITAAAAAIFAPYKIDNVKIDCLDIAVNKPKVAPYRAPGAPIAAFATESLIDQAASSLDIDPRELRLINAAKEGDRRADGVMNGKRGVIETLKQVKSHSHYQSKKNGLNVGRGVSLGFCRNNSGPASLVASVLPDGTISLVEGSVDVGGSRTAIAQIMAEVLGLRSEDVIPQVGDTDSIGFTSVTGGSGVAYKSGWAAHEAAIDIKNQIVKRAATIWGKDEAEVEYSSGLVRHKSDSELKMSFKEIASQLNDTGEPIMGKANVNPGGTTGSYSALIADVQVDPETGKVDLLKLTAFQDVGYAIHPSYVEGQIQGGIAQGIGWALNEEYFYDDKGIMRNNSLLDYRMPISLDLPDIEAVMVEVPNPNHPYGVKGVGEASISSPLAAIANAINDAVGIRMRSLPMKPQKLQANL